jgi:hypothetical protein
LSAFKFFKDDFGEVIYIREDFMHLTVMIEYQGRTKAGVLPDPSFFDRVNETNAFAPVEAARKALRWATVTPAEPWTGRSAN